MSAMPNPARSELYAGLLPVEPLAEPPPVRPTTLENDPPQSRRPSLRKRASRAFTRYLIAFFIGVTATLAWQSYGDAARDIIASSYPQLGWLAPQPAPTAQNAPDVIALAAPAAPSPDQQQVGAMSLDLDAVRQSLDQIGASQERIARTVDQLAAGQEQMTREITKLQAIGQYILYKNSEPPPQLATPPARKPVPRSSQAPTMLTPTRNP